VGKNNKRSSTCVYCGRNAKTRDHVPAKCLLNQPYPNNLFTVSSCKDCNEDFSKDEEYLLFLIATIGDSPTLSEKQMPNGLIDRAVARNPSLYDRIIDKLAVDENNRVYLTPESDRVHRVVLKIASGIYYKKYKLSRPQTDFTYLGTFHGFDQIPTPLIVMAHTERFTPKKWTIVQRDVFSYTIVRNWQNSRLILFINLHNTLWSCVEMKPPTRGSKKHNAVLSHQNSLFADSQ